MVAELAQAYYYYYYYYLLLIITPMKQQENLMRGWRGENEEAGGGERGRGRQTASAKIKG
jgi:hypothetical protein